MTSDCTRRSCAFSSISLSAAFKYARQLRSWVFLNLSRIVPSIEAQVATTFALRWDWRIETQVATRFALRWDWRFGIWRGERSQICGHAAFELTY